MALTALQAGVIAAACRYAYTRQSRWAVTAGVLLGLMFATKETALIAAACMAVAAYNVAKHRLLNWPHIVAALAIAGITAALLLGIPEMIDAVRTYVVRGGWGQRHIEPPFYYLRILLWFQRPRGPIWSEALIPVLAIAGAVAGWHRGLLRFLAVFTILMAVAYSPDPLQDPVVFAGFPGRHGSPGGRRAGRDCALRQARTENWRNGCNWARWVIPRL